MTETTPAAIRAALDDILPGVQKPSRYLGLERNLVPQGAGTRSRCGWPSPSPTPTRSG